LRYLRHWSLTLAPRRSYADLLLAGKLKFALVELRYRWRKKNANQQFAVGALVNLFQVRKRLLPNANAVTGMAKQRLPQGGLIQSFPNEERLLSNSG